MPVVKFPVFSSIVKNSSQFLNTLVPDLLEYQYDSVLNGGASSVEMLFRNTNNSAPVAALPVLGDYIEIKNRYQGDSLELNSGTLRIDFFERQFMPTTIRYGATSFDYGLSVANFGQTTYSNTSLSTIVNQIATSANLTVNGNPSTEIVGTSPTAAGTRTVTSNGNQLQLLQSLATTYGYAFNLKFGFLFFQSWQSLEASLCTYFLNAADTNNIRIQGRSSGLYRTALALYNTNSSASYVNDTVSTNANFNLAAEGFYFNVNSALLRSAGAIYSNALNREVMFVDMPGDYIYAGDIVYVNGTNVDGKYIVRRVLHTWTPTGGWQMTIEMTRVFGTLPNSNNPTNLNQPTGRI